MELGSSIREALLACAESAEVLCRLGHDLVIELKVDTTALFYREGRISSVPVSVFRIRICICCAKTRRERLLKLTLNRSFAGNLARRVHLNFWALPC